MMALVVLECTANMKGNTKYMVVGTITNWENVVIAELFKICFILLGFDKSDTEQMTKNFVVLLLFINNVTFMTSYTR